MKKAKFLFLIVFVAITNFALSQGVTTSSIKGKVTLADNAEIVAATVEAVHVPSGTRYGTFTRNEGRFDIKGMKVGGPYTVVVSYMGYQKKEINDVYLQLNQVTDLALVLSKEDQQIEEVVVTFDKTDVMNSDRTGSATFIDSKSITKLPTIARSQKDFTRLTPQSNGNSFGGRNNLYNNFSLDGSIFNNSYGLDYATPGGQADAQPVSLDAIEQLQVSLAPFDVREGGFTGAGVNAVTKSGTNQFKGTAYTFLRNQALVGKKVNGEEITNTDFSTQQYGISVGGPIVKDKLFFFFNAEGERRDQVAHGFVANNGDGTSDPGETSVLATDLQAVHDHLLNEWGYEAGAYDNYNHQAYNDKILAKLDWNINNKHNLSVRYNYLYATKDILPHPEAIIGRGPTSFRLPFENSSYTIVNQINSVVSELNSRFGEKLSNKLMIGYTEFRDKRNPHSAPFPVIDIFDANGNLSISAGSEMFSTNNVLNQNVFQFTNNLTYYSNKHTLTAGINYEQFYFENSFNLFYYPWYTYDLAGFLATTRADVDYNADVQNAQKNDPFWAYVKVGQLGLYVQDEINPSDNLSLTFGLRVDMPVYLNEIPDDVANVVAFDKWIDEEGNPATIDPSAWPKANPLFAPRFGFNWDVKGDKTMKLRGGTGIFTGRIPFVWLGNQASNARIDPGYEFQVNATTQDFKFPQVWKTDLALDQKFGQGWVATLEGIFSKDINAVVHRNYNMTAPTAALSGADTRAIYGPADNTNIFSSDNGFTDFLEAGAIVLDNTKQGYQYTLTAQLGKFFQSGLALNAAYTYSESKDLTSIPAEIAADAFQRNPIVSNPNDPMFAHSRYGLQHRFISSAMYTKNWKLGETAISAFFELAKGNRYSYTYAGDLNQDAIANNDLIYIPASASEIKFGTVDVNGVGTEAADAAAQWTALEAFINQDEYLSQHKGEIAERHGAMLPWFSQLDIRLAHTFGTKIAGKDNKLQVSLDILNFGNMINSNWGVRKLASTWNPLTVNGLDTNNVPYFSFNTNLKDSYVDDASLASKWQMQVGIRYIFN